MRRVRVATLLIGVNVVLVLVVIAIGGLVAVPLLRHFADEQGLARVSQTAAIGQAAITRSGADVANTARLLAERPTLARLVAADDLAATKQFLAQFTRTSDVSGSVVVRDGTAWATSGAAPTALFTATLNTPLLVESDGALVLAHVVPLASVPNVRVGVWRRLDAAYAAELSATLGLATQIRERTGVAADRASPSFALRQAALLTNQPQVDRLDSLGQYSAIVPLGDGTTPVGIIEVRQSTASLQASVSQLLRTLLLVALGVGVAAAIINLLVGRRYLGTPLLALQRAAARIGGGDLASPITSVRGAEIGMLATTLEEMRGRLSHVTGDLRRQQAESNAILTSIVEGVFTVDRDRRIRYLNPQTAALLGLEADAVLGQFCGDVLRPQERDGVRPCETQCPIIHARFRGGARATEHLLLRDGSRRTVVITSASLAADGQVQVLRDETEIEASRRLRDTILATISHEFRTPLSAQLASLELLIEQLPTLSLAQIQHLVLAVQRGTTRLTYLIDNLLESARIEAGELAIRRRTITLDCVLDDALEMMRPLLAQREQTVDLALPYPLPPLLGDATRLTQVFVNLLANASKFAPSGSTISIGGAVNAADVTVWVDDEGPGLPLAAADTLFSRFVRSRVAEPEQSGVGLGLWIVQSIVERHGGRVSALPLPNGTRLAVRLPLGGNNETAGG